MPDPHVCAVLPFPRPTRYPLTPHRAELLETLAAHGWPVRFPAHVATATLQDRAAEAEAMARLESPSWEPLPGLHDTNEELELLEQGVGRG